MSTCRNPECRNGFTPGVIAAGRGNAKIPIVGATMRWGWVNCRACSPKDKDPAYVHVQRLPSEVQERARLADSKAAYDHAKATQKQLEAVKAATPVPSSSAVTAPSNATFDKLLSQIEKLTDQITELLAENRELRRKLESHTLTGVVEVAPLEFGKAQTKRSKKGGRRETSSEDDGRPLS